MRAVWCRVTQPSADFECPRCATVRPLVCLRCHKTRFRNLRAGVTRVREELEALASEEVVDVTADGDELRPARVHVGTEAALHRVIDADAVAFLDFDQELLAPRYRAAEEAFALLARAAAARRRTPPRFARARADARPEPRGHRRGLAHGSGAGSRGRGAAPH